jgi:four helix bundle protein
MQNKKIESYKDLLVWQKGIELVGDVYLITKKLPKEETYGLTSQIRRAAVSVPANIAEGWGRNSTKNYVQFIRIACGSLYELETLLIIAGNQNFFEEANLTELKRKIEELSKMMNRLLQSLEKYIEN